MWADQGQGYFVDNEVTADGVMSALLGIVYEYLKELIKHRSKASRIIKLTGT